MSHKHIPHFTSDADEAAWWFANRDKDDENLEQSIADGRVRRGSLATRLAESRGEVAPPDRADVVKKALELATKLLAEEEAARLDLPSNLEDLRGAEVHQLRLSASDREVADSLARKRGQSVQTLLASLIHDALQKEAADLHAQDLSAAA